MAGCAGDGAQRLVRLAGTTVQGIFAAGREFAGCRARGYDLRDRRLPPFFATAIRGNLHHGNTEVVVTGDHVLGCAIWLAPGTWRPPLRRQLMALPSVVFRLRSRLGVASITYGALLAAHPHRPHWYLSGIGTDPPVQGSGVGGALMRSRLARCDAVLHLLQRHRLGQLSPQSGRGRTLSPHSADRPRPIAGELRLER